MADPTQVAHVVPHVKHAVHHITPILKGFTMQNMLIASGVSLLVGIVLDGYFGIYSTIKGWFTKTATTVETTANTVKTAL